MDTFVIARFVNIPCKNALYKLCLATITCLAICLMVYIILLWLTDICVFLIDCNPSAPAGHLPHQRDALVPILSWVPTAGDS